MGFPQEVFKIQGTGGYLTCLAQGVVQVDFDAQIVTQNNLAMSEELCKFSWLPRRKGGSKVQVFGVKAIQGFNWGSMGEIVLVNFYKGSLGIKDSWARLGNTGSVVFAWFIRGMSGFRIIGRRGSGARIATAGVRKVRCVGLGVRGLWDTGFEAGAVLLLLGRLWDQLLLEEEARLPNCWVK
jgi:hypothetical protein